MTPGHRVSPWLTVGTAAVAFLAITGAVNRLAAYAGDPRQLWHAVTHDRHGHFNFGLDLALALRDFDVIGFLSHLERAKVWPPLHGLVLAATMLVGDIDLKLAIVPSLIGWTATIVLVWLIGLRLFADPRTGALAGGIAVAFALMSPGFRLITSDVMLEGLGAALSCFCVYSYLRAREAPEETLWWRVLAIAFTALFFEKFNYWLLTLVPLGLAFMLDEPDRIRTILARLRNGAAAARQELRHPLNWAFVVMLTIVIAIWAHGPLVVHVFGAQVSLYPPGNLLTLAYSLLFVRVALAWWRHRAAFESTVGTALRQFTYWHALPVTASFLIPKRLAPFLWYLGPTHHHGVGYNPVRAALVQWDGFASGFHVAHWAAILVAAGIVLALTMLLLRRAGPALRAVALVGLIGAIAVVLHPQQQLRFQTTILPPLWILAGAGWAMLIAALIARLPQPAGHAACAAAIGALLLAQTGYPLKAMAYTVSIHPLPGSSNYATFEAYRSYLDGARAVGFVTSLGRSAFYQWTVAEHCKCRKKVEQPFAPWDVDREQTRALTAAWLARVNVDTIVAITEFNPTELAGVINYDRMKGQFDALAEQTRFVKIATLKAPVFAGEITIWRRRDVAGAATAPPHRQSR